MSAWSIAYANVFGLKWQFILKSELGVISAWFPVCLLHNKAELYTYYAEEKGRQGNDQSNISMLWTGNLTLEALLSFLLQNISKRKYK